MNTNEQPLPECKHENVSQGNHPEEGYMVVCKDCHKDLTPSKSTPSPDDLAKAIESLKIELLRKERDWQEWFLNDINTVLDAAKQVQKLQCENEDISDAYYHQYMATDEINRRLGKECELSLKLQQQVETLREQLNEAKAEIVAQSTAIELAENGKYGRIHLQTKILELEQSSRRKTS